MQYINFLEHIEQPKKPWLTLQNTVLITAGLGGVLLLSSLLFSLGNANLEQKVQQLSSLQSTLREDVAAQTQLQQETLNNTLVTQEISRLQEAIKLRQMLLKDMSGSATAPSSVGFAPYLSGLANQSEGKLWLTQIHLAKGGKHLSLQGATDHPESVFQYLQRLRNEPVFRGQQFQVFRMARPSEDSKSMQFDIRAKQTLDKASAK